MVALPEWTKPFADGVDVDEMNAHIAAWQGVLSLQEWEIRFAPIAPDDEERASHDIDVTRALTEHGESAAAFLRGQWTRSQEWVIERLTTLITGKGIEHWHDDPAWTSAFPVSS